MMGIQLDNQDNRLLMVLKKITHDLESPVSALKMFYEHLKDLSEADKRFIHGATNRIERIVESSNKKASEYENSIINVQDTIIQILREKEMEYHKSDLQFIYTQNSTANNAKIKGDIGDFERMLSNLLNNAAQACADKAGIINIDLRVTDRSIFLTISDNGNGMPTEVLEKLRTGVSVTHGKANGHGVGFVQIHDTIKNLNGTLYIDSTLGGGSEFSIRFGLDQ